MNSIDSNSNGSVTKSDKYPAQGQQRDSKGTATRDSKSVQKCRSEPRRDSKGQQLTTSFSYTRAYMHAVWKFVRAVPAVPLLSLVAEYNHY